MDALESDAGGWSLALGGAEAYGLRVAASWAELLEGFVAREKGGEALTPAVVWTEFKQQTAQSTRAEVQRLAEIGEGMTPADRIRFVAGVMPLVATLDWPSAWEAPRRELVVALEMLVFETDEKEATSFAGLLLSLLDDEHGIAGSMLSSARISLELALLILRRPCVPADLGPISVLCVLGTSGVVNMAMAEPLQFPRLVDARTRYLAAFERYARTARAMNDTVGAVVFHGLDLGAQGVR